jgi:hypothetical protein
MNNTSISTNSTLLALVQNVNQFTILEAQTLRRGGKKITGTVSSGYYVTYFNEETNRECMSMTVHKQ